MSVQLRTQGEGLPTAQALLIKAEEIRQGELKKAFGHLKRLSEEERNALVVLATAITDGILREPLQRLHVEAARDYDGVLRDLFGLDGDAARAGC